MSKTSARAVVLHLCTTCGRAKRGKVRAGVFAACLGLTIALSVHAQISAGSAEQQIEAEGVHLLRGGKAAEAKLQFDRAVALAPADADPLTWRGIAENQLADYAAAATDFRRALALKGGLLSARYNLALSLIRLHQTDEAIVELRKVAAAQPQAPEPPYNLGVLLASKGLTAEAAQAFGTAHALRPEDAGITLHLLQALLASHSQSELTPLIHEIAATTGSPELQQQAGAALLEAGRPAEAVVVLEAAQGHGATTPESSLLLTRALMGAGRALEALALEQELYRQDPTPARSLQLARVLLANDRAEQAVALLRGMSDNAAESAERNTLLGIGLAATHQIPEAIVHLEKAVAVDAALPLANSVLGFCYFTQGAYAQAATAYARASDLETAQPLFARNAAVAYERANEPEQGLRYAERANAQDAGGAEDRVLLAKFLLKAGRDSEALEQLQKAAALNPDLDAADYLLARTYARLGNQEEAAAWAARLAKLKQRHEAVFLAQKQASATISNVRSSKLLEGGALDAKQTEAVR